MAILSYCAPLTAIIVVTIFWIGFELFLTVQKEGGDAIKESVQHGQLGTKKLQPQASRRLELRGLEILKLLNKSLSKSCLSSLAKLHIKVQSGGLQ